MAIPKANTLQQKLGFFDEDLKSPDHDSILKWLDNNIDKVIDSIYDFREWNETTVKDISDQVNKIIAIDIEFEKIKVQKIEKEIADDQKHINDLKERQLKEFKKEKENVSSYSSSNWIKESIDKAELEIEEKRKALSSSERKIKYLADFDSLPDKLPQRRKPRITDKIWEYTVTNQSINQRTGYQSPKNVIGFIDMKVTFIYTRLTVCGVDFNRKQIIGKLAWAQTENLDYHAFDLCSINLLIEVKTKIPSLGELFRQLNTYKEYEKGDYLVVCPDDSNMETIIKQGFKFYKFQQ